MRGATSRRNFLRSSLVAAGACGLPGFALADSSPNEAPVGTPPVRLGLASYTLRNFTRAQVIAMMKQVHITELNAKDVKDHLPADPALEAAALADYATNGIHLHAIGALYLPKDDEQSLRSNFEYAKRAGVTMIVAGDPAPESLPKIERFVKEYDIRLAIHNHGPEDKIWHSPLDVLKQVRDLDPRLGCCIDIGHCVRSGIDVVEAIHTAGPRLFNLHAKDLTNFTTKESQVAVGEGIMPMRAIFKALIETKYQGFVDLEYEIHADDPMPGVISSFGYMCGVLAGMGYPTHNTLSA